MVFIIRAIIPSFSLDPSASAPGGSECAIHTAVANSHDAAGSMSIAVQAGDLYTEKVGEARVRAIKRTKPARNRAIIEAGSTEEVDAVGEGGVFPELLEGVLLEVDEGCGVGGEGSRRSRSLSKPAWGMGLT